MKLRFDRMYKAVEGNPSLERLFLLFCFQGFLLEGGPFSRYLDPLSEETFLAYLEIVELGNLKDAYESNPSNIFKYDDTISFKNCIVGEIHFGPEEKRWHKNQGYECSSSTLYAIPFMYYLKQYFQPSKNKEVLSQLFKDALLVKGNVPPTGGNTELKLY
jgi:hypothetical protein